MNRNKLFNSESLSEDDIRQIKLDLYYKLMKRSGDAGDFVESIQTEMPSFLDSSSTMNSDIDETTLELKQLFR